MVKKKETEQPEVVQEQVEKPKPKKATKPKAEVKEPAKKTKKAKKLKCFSRLDSKKNRYVTCIKPKKTKKGAGRFPLNYFGAPMHKNYNKKSRCLNL